MAQALFYSSNAVAMTLGAGIASGDTTCNLSSASGLPASFPFKLLIGWGTGQQEVVHCTALAGTVATIARGQDGTTAQSHSIGATVVHGVSAREFNDLELHVGSTSGVHGTSGSVVGTTDTQTLTNKSFDATSTVSGSPLVGTTAAQTLTNKTFSPSTTAGIGVVVKGLPSQSGDLQQWQNSGGTPVAAMGSAGKLSFGDRLVVGNAAGTVINSGHPATVSVYSLQVGDTPIVVQGFSGQVGDLQQWTDSGGTALAKIDAAGNISATNLTNSWTAYTPTFTNCTSPAGSFAFRLQGKTLNLRGWFTGGTATGAGAITVSLPAGSSSVAVTQLVQAEVGAALAIWTVNGGSTPTVITSAAFTAGQSLGSIFSATLEVA